MAHASGQVIFRRYRKVGNRVLDAHDYGLRAWLIRLKGKRKKS